jgi:hypothetical protein
MGLRCVHCVSSYERQVAGQCRGKVGWLTSLAFFRAVTSAILHLNDGDQTTQRRYSAQALPFQPKFAAFTL